MAETETTAIIESKPSQMAKRLFELRRLILETAAADPRIGPLEETLKWGEPAFVPSHTRSGTTVRINAHRQSDSIYALYVHCSTDLVSRWRELYADELEFDGNRAILFDAADSLPEGPVRHCISMAFTYHLDR